MEQDLLKQCYRDELCVGKLLWYLRWKLLHKGKILYCITNSMHHRCFGRKEKCKQDHQTDNLCRPFSTLSTLFRICSMYAFGTAEFQELFKIILLLHSVCCTVFFLNIIEENDKGLSICMAYFPLNNSNFQKCFKTKQYKK